MRVHVRGQMGVQLMQAFVGIGRLADDEKPILVVNSGGDVPGAKTSQLHFVTDPQCEVREDHEGIRKTPYWHSGAARIAFLGRERTLRWIPLRDHEYGQLHGDAVVVHARGGDKAVASVDTYTKLVDLAKKRHPDCKVYVLSDSQDLLDALVPPKDEIGGDVDEDWFTILEAKHVYAAPSGFVMSTLLFNPQKKVTFIGPSWCDGSYPAVADDFTFIEEAKEFCPNLEVLE